MMESSEILKLRKQLKLINETVSNEIYNLGDSLFENIVIKLNETLEADYTFIGELNESRTEITTISLASKAGILENFSYLVKDTPCELVIGQKPCSFPKNVASLFPNDQLLVDMEIQAYTGIPLYSSKSEATGILVCMFENTISNIFTYESILLIFASRAGAEIEHMKLYASLDEHKKELENKVRERTKELNKKNHKLKKSNKELSLTIGKLSEAQNQLIHSEKMASLGILTAGVAHEINNPLNFILGGYTGLKNYFEGTNNTANDEVNFFLNSINVGVERASKIIDGLSQFSRSTDSYDENCDIHRILDDCLIMLNISIEDNIHVKKQYTKANAVIKGNLGKLHQVFLNILNNSVQALIHPGEIVVQTKHVGTWIEIRLTDTGCGVSETNLSRITNPFFTTKQPGEGTGLGLSISFSIIKDHSGTIAFESKEGSYTTVIIKLPLNKAEDE